MEANRILFVIPASALLVTSLTTSSAFSAETESLEFAQRAHQAARDGIQTCYCRVALTGTFAQGSTTVSQGCSGEYWFSRDAIRAKVIDTQQGDLEYVWSNSIRKSLVTKRRDVIEEVGAHLGSYPERYLHRCDAWTRGLLVLNVPGTIAYVPFEKLVGEATRVDSVQRKRVGGRDQIIVRLFFEKGAKRSADWTAQIHLDSAANYLAQRVSYKTGEFEREDEVVQFKECGDGVFFPERIVGKSGSVGSYTAEISDIQVNTPLAKDVFELRFPSGVYMTDSVRNTRYQVDEVGNRISDEQPLGRDPAPPPLAEGVQAATRTETAHESRSWTRWIAPISLAILAVAGLAYFLRRRRQRRSIPDPLVALEEHTMARFMVCCAIFLTAAACAIVQWTFRDTSDFDEPCAATTSDPAIDYPRLLDLGDREFGDVAIATYTIANRGGRELIVDQVRTNCSCAGLERELGGNFVRVDGLRLAPGETAQMRMRVTVGGVPVGSQMVNAIEFATNDPSQPRGRVEAVVRRMYGGVFTSPNSAVIGTVVVGDTVRQTLDVWDQAATPRNIERVTSNQPDRVQVQLLPVEAPIRKTELGQELVQVGRLEVTVDTKTPGSILTEIQIRLAGETRRSDSVPVIGEVVAPVVITPSLMLLPRRSSHGPIHSMICTCRSSRGTPVEVTIEDVPPGLTVERLERTDRSVSCFRVTLHPNRSKGVESELIVRLRAKTEEGEFSIELPVIVDDRE